MNEILQVKDVKALQNNMPVDGYVYVKDYSQLLTSSGNPYFNINIESDGTLNCKAWSTSEAFKTLGSTDLRNKVVRITAKTNEYNGMISLIINDIYEYTGTELSAVDFLSTPYDLSLYDGFMTFMKGKISLDMYTILEKLMYLYGDAFKNEYASVGHHDNVRHGLLAHSYKVTKIAQVVRFYPGIKDEIDMDLLYFSAAMHDIGKVWEYNMGIMTEEGKLLSHRTLGIHMIEAVKQDILSVKGDKFYTDLIAVIQQHHDEYGENAKTIMAYMIHKFDELDAILTDIESGIAVAKNAGVNIVRFNDKQYVM